MVCLDVRSPPHTRRISRRAKGAPAAASTEEGLVCLEMTTGLRMQADESPRTHLAITTGVVADIGGGAYIGGGADGGADMADTNMVPAALSHREDPTEHFHEGFSSRKLALRRGGGYALSLLPLPLPLSLSLPLLVALPLSVAQPLSVDLSGRGGLGTHQVT